MTHTKKLILICMTLSFQSQLALASDASDADPAAIQRFLTQLLGNAENVVLESKWFEKDRIQFTTRNASEIYQLDCEIVSNEAAKHLEIKKCNISDDRDQTIISLEQTQTWRKSKYAQVLKGKAQLARVFAELAQTYFIPDSPYVDISSRSRSISFKQAGLHTNGSRILKRMAINLNMRKGSLPTQGQTPSRNKAKVAL